MAEIVVADQNSEGKLSSAPGTEKGTEGATPTAAISYVMLDQTLWNRFREAADPWSYLAAWLALACRSIGPDVRGLLVMGEPDVGPFEPAALWPDAAAPPHDFVQAAEQAAQQRRGVVLGEGEARRLLAQPILIAGHLHGVVVVALTESDPPTVEALRRLSWSSGWIEVLTRREQESIDGELRERTAAAFDVLAGVLEQPRFDAACHALVSDLARRLACNMVSLGFIRWGRCRVVAVSNAAGFGRRLNLIRDIGHGMDEAVDQRLVIMAPAPEDWEFRVTRAHDEILHSHKAGAVLTLPLQANGRIVGALMLERGRGESFDAALVEVADAITAVVGPILEERRRNDRLLVTKIAESLGWQARRLLGPSYFGRKLATLAVLAVIGVLSVATGNYAVSSPATLRGTVQRSVVAPFPSYVAAQYARSGDVVAESELLASLDDQDLSLERMRLVNARSQREAEYDRALSERDLAEANIIRAQIEQADAQLALVEEQLARTRIVAPFAGVVVSGDLTQRVGASVDRGETLFQIAPLGEFRVMLEVDERDILEIRPGQTGLLRVSAMPEVPLEYRIERITPISEQGGGRNFFVVEAALTTTHPEVRPGMKGIARTDVDERLLVRIWTDRLVDWARIAFWKWMP